jgi:hypothetical protein
MKRSGEGVEKILLAVSLSVDSESLEGLDRKVVGGRGLPQDSHHLTISHATKTTLSYQHIPQKETPPINLPHLHPNVRICIA